MPGKPGRVVTLLSHSDPEIDASRRLEASCWGTAYEVGCADRKRVLEGLDHRERGGYQRVEVDITLRSPSTPRRIVHGLMYVADCENENYLGPASIDRIADQILAAAGPSGPNPEYVFELAESLRGMSAIDEHVFEVESALRRRSWRPNG